MADMLSEAKIKNAISHERRLKIIKHFHDTVMLYREFSALKLSIQLPTTTQCRLRDISNIVHAHYSLPMSFDLYVLVKCYGNLH